MKNLPAWWRAQASTRLGATWCFRHRPSVLPSTHSPSRVFGWPTAWRRAQARSPLRPRAARPGAARCAAPAAAWRSRRPSPATSPHTRRTGCPLAPETASFALQGLIVKSVVVSIFQRNFIQQSSGNWTGRQ